MLFYTSMAPDIACVGECCFILEKAPDFVYTSMAPENGQSPIQKYF